MRANEPAAIPGQVAEELAGQQFETFADLRKAIWKSIAANDELSSSFSAASLGNMKRSMAPFAPPEYQTGLSDAGMRFNIHHVESIESGGTVYDLSNLQIVSPKVHAEIHY